MWCPLRRKVDQMRGSLTNRSGAICESSTCHGEQTFARSRSAETNPAAEPEVGICLHLLLVIHINRLAWKGMVMAPCYLL